MESGTTRSMLQAVLDTIQLELGLGAPILKETRSLDYIEWGWIPQIQEFLHHINGKISGATEQPKQFREHDEYIMDHHTLNEKTYKERMLIHRCRLYLQVETLSNITNTLGTRIIEAWMDPDQPKLSYSTKKWPKQQPPGKEAWKIWRKFLNSAYTMTNGLLKQPLGDWIHRNEHHRHRHYDNPAEGILYIVDDNKIAMYREMLESQRTNVFHNKPNSVNQNIPDTELPINHVCSTETKIITHQETKFRKKSEDTTNTMPMRFQTTLQAQKHDILLHNVMILLDDEDLLNRVKNPVNFKVATGRGV
jgi:hypothetical protein